MIAHTDRRINKSVTKSGNNPLDIMKNIYDFEGNCREWTASAGFTFSRLARGDYDTESRSYYYPASSIDYGVPYAKGTTISSRIGLYVEI